MGPGLQFILALGIALTSLTGGSLIWPRLTDQPRPELLEKVHDIALQTSVGKQGAQVLGVSDESQVEPINVGQLVTNALDGVKTAAQNRVQTIIVGNAVNQLSSQFDRLPEGQKEQIQQILCKAPAQ
jgi:hypothetical protein